MTLYKLTDKSMQPARDALEQVQAVLEDGGRSAYALWAILTALRAPDARNSQHKECITEVLRYRVFGKTACDTIGANASPDSEELAKRRSALLFGPECAMMQGHFTGHARIAFDALDTLEIP